MQSIRSVFTKIISPSISLVGRDDQRKLLACPVGIMFDTFTHFVGTFFQLVNINKNVHLYTLKASLFYSPFHCLKQETVLQVCLVTKTLWSCIIYTPPPISHFAVSLPRPTRAVAAAPIVVVVGLTCGRTLISPPASPPPSLPPLRAVQAHSPTGARH